MTQEITGTLENWSKDKIFRILWGEIYGDTKGRFPDGTLIHTSDLNISPRQMKTLKKGAIVSTRNSRYRLGEKQKIE